MFWPVARSLSVVLPSLFLSLTVAAPPAVGAIGMNEPWRCQLGVGRDELTRGFQAVAGLMAKLADGERVAVVLDIRANSRISLERVVRKFEEDGIVVGGYRFLNGRAQLVIVETGRQNLQRLVEHPYITRVGWRQIIPAGRRVPNFLNSPVPRAPGEPRRVLVVSSTFGAGHESASKAIRDSILLRDPSVVVDVIPVEWLRGRARNEVERRLWWGTILRAPWLYTLAFNATMQLGQENGTRAILPHHIPAADLQRFILRGRPDVRFNEHGAALIGADTEGWDEAHPSGNYDTVIAAHQLTANVLADIRESGSLHNVRVGFLQTDYYEGMFPGTSRRMATNADPEMTMTFVAHPVLETAWRAAGVPASQIRVTGMPINPAIHRGIENVAAMETLEGGAAALDALRAQLGTTDVQRLNAVIAERRLGRATFLRSQGFDPAVLTITLQSGGEGVGDFPLIVRKLVEAFPGHRLQIFAVPARNARNFAALQPMIAPLAQQGVTLRVFEGFVTQAVLFSLIHSADLYITKSAGLSPTEGFATNRPIILLGGVYGGHERINAQVFGQLGVAMINWDERDIGAQARELLDSPGRVRAMVQAQRDFIGLLNFEPIVDFALGLPQQAP